VAIRSALTRIDEQLDTAIAKAGSSSKEELARAAGSALHAFDTALDAQPFLAALVTLNRADTWLKRALAAKSKPEGDLSFAADALRESAKELADLPAVDDSLAEAIDAVAGEADAAVHGAGGINAAFLKNLQQKKLALIALAPPLFGVPAKDLYHLIDEIRDPLLTAQSSKTAEGVLVELRLARAFKEQLEKRLAAK
jgi:hypothetical protein